MSEKIFEISAESIKYLIEGISPGEIAYAMPGEGVMRVTSTGYCVPFIPGQTDVPMYSHSTTREEYFTGCNDELELLRREGGKTVYSRVIAGHSRRSLNDVIAEFFSELPYTFRFVTLTTDGQYWIGASPELLIDNRPGEDTLYTCALAGTRRITVNSSTPWDRKNIVEHRMVSEFIFDMLDSFGLDPVAETTDTRRYGSLVHLHTPIHSRSAQDCHKLLDCLSPTPALAGFPRERALERLNVIEKHRRGYYGGYIAVELDAGRTVAFVNLRSMRVDNITCSAFDYNIFVGGGLNAGSDPIAEWNETTMKASLLYSIVNNNTNELN